MYLKQWSVIKRILSSEYSCTQLEAESKTNWGWGEGGDESEDESTRHQKRRTRGEDEYMQEEVRQVNGPLTHVGVFKLKNQQSFKETLFVKSWKRAAV